MPPACFFLKAKLEKLNLPYAELICFEKFNITYDINPISRP